MRVLICLIFIFSLVCVVNNDSIVEDTREENISISKEEKGLIIGYGTFPDVYRSLLPSYIK